MIVNTWRSRALMAATPSVRLSWTPQPAMASTTSRHAFGIGVTENVLDRGDRVDGFGFAVAHSARAARKSDALWGEDADRVQARGEGHRAGQATRRRRSVHDATPQHGNAEGAAGVGSEREDDGAVATATADPDERLFRQRVRNSRGFLARRARRYTRKRRRSRHRRCAEHGVRRRDRAE